MHNRGDFFMEQVCRIFEMGYKEVICVANGARIGSVFDAEIDVDTGLVKSLIVPGKQRFFGIFGREEDIIIPWDSVEKIGDDLILVSHDVFLPRTPPRKRRLF